MGGERAEPQAQVWCRLVVQEGAVVSREVTTASGKYSGTRVHLADHPAKGTRTGNMPHANQEGATATRLGATIPLPVDRLSLA